MMAPPKILSQRPQYQALRVFWVPQKVHKYQQVASDNPGVVLPIVVEGEFVAVVSV